MKTVTYRHILTSKHTQAHPNTAEHIQSHAHTSILFDVSHNSSICNSGFVIVLCVLYFLHHGVLYSFIVEGNEKKEMRSGLFKNVGNREFIRMKIYTYAFVRHGSIYVHIFIESLDKMTNCPEYRSGSFRDK